MYRKVKTKNRFLIKFKLKYLLFIMITIILVLLLSLYAVPKTQIYKDYKDNNVPKGYSTVTQKEQQNLNKKWNEEKEKLMKTGVSYLVIEKLNVSIPIYNYSGEDSVYNILDHGALTYPEYGKTGVGNLILLGHHTQVNTYFTPLFKGLKVGDIISIQKIENDKLTTTKYKTRKQETVKEEEVDKVYYKSDKPIITLVTCDIAGETPNRIVWTGELEK